MDADQGRFPTDETTLTLLIAACQINPDTGRTHLHDFLDMGARVKSSSLIAGSEDPEDADTPVYEIEHEPGFEPFSPNQVIITLAEELLRLREAIVACVMDAEGVEAFERGTILTLTRGQVRLLREALGPNSKGGNE